MTGFEEIALPHLQSVASLALSLTGSDADADTLVQETFLRAFRDWHTFTPGTDCRRWLFTICRNASVRPHSRKPEYVQRDEGDMDAMPAAVAHMQAVRDGIADAFDHIAVRPVIEAAVQALPEPHHSILVLVDLEGQSYEEAAAVLGIPLGVVRSRLYRARRHVQETILTHARVLGVGRRALPVRERPAATSEQQQASSRPRSSKAAWTNGERRGLCARSGGLSSLGAGQLVRIRDDEDPSDALPVH